MLTINTTSALFPASPVHFYSAVYTRSDTGVSTCGAARFPCVGAISRQR